MRMNYPELLNKLKPDIKAIYGAVMEEFEKIWPVIMNVLEGEPYTYTDDRTSNDETEFLSKLSELANNDVVYILNALPYARVLEYGLYGRAPALLSRLPVMVT